MSRGQPEMHSKCQASCGRRRETLYPKGDQKEAWCWVPAARAPEHQIHPPSVCPWDTGWRRFSPSPVEGLYTKEICCLEGPKVAGRMAEGLGMTALSSAGGLLRERHSA